MFSFNNKTKANIATPQHFEIELYLREVSQHSVYLIVEGYPTHIV